MTDLLDCYSFVFAGALSLPGRKVIQKTLAKQGMTVEFIEAPFMERYIKTQNESSKLLNLKENDFTFTDNIPTTDNKKKIVIPLTEYWLSYCIKTGQCLINKQALKASRSKSLLYQILLNNGLKTPLIYNSIKEAYDALKNGNKVIVKPDGLNSGQGVEVITPENPENINICLKEAAAINTHNMKLCDVQNNGVIMTQHITGTEYSADCFIYNGIVTIVRICKKLVTTIHGKPCTNTYEFIDLSFTKSNLLINICNSLTKAMHILFTSDDVSFAQFDFVVSDDSDSVVIIDFATRIGGGLYELFSTLENNVYAQAVELAILKAKQKVDIKQPLIPENLKPIQVTQLNYLPITKGYLIKEFSPPYDELGEVALCNVYKHQGDYVSGLPSSIGSRIAVVIKHGEFPVKKTENLTFNMQNSIPKNVLSGLLIGDELILDKVKMCKKFL